MIELRIEGRHGQIDFIEVSEFNMPRLVRVEAIYAGRARRTRRTETLPVLTPKQAHELAHVIIAVADRREDQYKQEGDG